MLSEFQVRNAPIKPKRYELKDYAGLVLDVTTKGIKTWRFRFKDKGKDYKLTLGRYPEISLKEARELRDKARVDRAHGINPVTQKTRPVTFGEVFEEWFDSQINGVKSPKYISNTLQRSGYLLEAFKNVPLQKITPADVLDVIRPIEERNCYDLAHRVKQLAGMVYRYGMAIGAVNFDPTYGLKGVLRPKQTKHYPALTDPEEVGELMRKIRDSVSLKTRCALMLHAYTFVRPGELRFAEWTEFDFETATWKIPAEKMKLRKVHIVPLSDQAMAVLQGLRALSARSKYLFPKLRNPDSPMSDMAENQAIERMGYRDKMTAHGFRGMASTLLHENRWHSDLIERQLSHQVGSTVAQAYNHAEYLEDRREMMQWWADYLDALRDGTKRPRRAR